MGLFNRFPGDKYLQEALRTSCSKLVDRPIGKLFKACLLGGSKGARMTLEHSQRSLQLWQDGDITKANRLLEVWGSTCMLQFYKDEEDQAGVIHHTARNFSAIFGSDLNTLETELTVFHEATMAGEARRSEKGDRHFIFQVLYLRHLRALGDPGVPSFDLLPRPWGTLYEMDKASNNNLPFDANTLIAVADWLIVPDAFLASMKAASDALPKS